MINVQLSIENDGSFEFKAETNLQLVKTKIEGTIEVEGNTNDIVSSLMSDNQEDIKAEIFASLLGLRPEQIANIKKSIVEDGLKKVNV